MQQENVPIKVGLLELLYGSQGTQFVIPAYQHNCTWAANKGVALELMCYGQSKAPYTIANMIN